MTITLPMVNQRWPKFRFLTRPSWGGAESDGGGWMIHPMHRPSPRASGFILLNYTRALLPQLGTAEFVFRYGMFSDTLIGASVATMTRMRQGEQYDPSIDSLEIPDLTGKEIRIQAAYPNEDDEVDAADWSTVWWGTCEYQIDQGWGAANLPSGERTYYCLDAFARTRRWFLDRHGYSDGSEVYAPAAGHPGYNVSPHSPAQSAGNKAPLARVWEPSQSQAVYAKCCTAAGAGEKWTDEEVLNNALVIARPDGQPLWTVSYWPGAAGAQALMAGNSPWPVDPNTPVFDLVGAICSRSRGKGAAFPTWTEGSPTGPLTCTLKIFSQLAADITYNDPTTGSDVTLDGAIADGTTVDVDLIGDHRFLPDSLRLGDPEQYRVDYLVSQGEPIEVLVTLEYNKTLERGWSDTDQTAFLALDPDERKGDKWSAVYQLHRLVRTFAMQLSNGNEGDLASADYKCTATGAITTEEVAGLGSGYLTSVTILDDIPLYDGYDYTSTVARIDGQTAAQYGGQPSRRPPMLMVRTEADRFRAHDEWSFNCQLRIMPDGLLLKCSDDQGTGERQIGDTEEDLGSEYDYEDLVLTVGIRLANRVQMTSGNPNGPRSLRVQHPDFHLWLAAPTAIWSLDSESDNGDGSLPKRGAATTISGVLRDDRAALARAHASTRVWYGLATPGVDDFASAHRGASWSLRCCGDIPTAEDYDGGGVVYATCGQVVRFLDANGQRIELNTPCSSFAYDNTAGVSTWTTDWQNLDVARR